MDHNLYSARSLQDLEAISKQHDIRVILHLGKDLQSSASRWGIRHLIAYRLLVSPPVNILPLLNSDHGQGCPLCNDHNAPCLQQLNPFWIRSLLGETPRDLCMKSEGELMQLPDGFFWVALARAARSSPDDPTKEYSQRERKPVERQNYINSTEAIDGSSSPIHSSSSEYEANLSFVDEDEHEERRRKPEEVTVHLVTNFLHHALSLCLLQHPTDQTTMTEVRPRVERMIQTTQIAGSFPISAEDDGGICKMVRRGQQCLMDHPYIVLIEATRAFTHVHFDEKSGVYIPHVSNENLAQYLGEAVITWKRNRKLLRDDVFLMATTNTFVRFIHFRFGCDYMEYLNASEEKAQLELIENEGKDAVVYMDSTKWFNLQSRAERRLALCHVFALLRWHDSISEEDESDFDGESDDDNMDTED